VEVCLEVGSIVPVICRNKLWSFISSFGGAIASNYAGNVSGSIFLTVDAADITATPLVSLDGAAISGAIPKIGVIGYATSSDNSLYFLTTPYKNTGDLFKLCYKAGAGSTRSTMSASPTSGSLGEAAAGINIGFVTMLIGESAAGGPWFLVSTRGGRTSPSPDRIPPRADPFLSG
jgi:hypothetical protein